MTWLQFKTLSSGIIQMLFNIMKGPLLELFTLGVKILGKGAELSVF